MSKGKERIDVLMVQKGLAPSREKAKAMVMAGQVFGDEQRIDKVGMEVPLDSIITIKGDLLPYVSRGGLKLAKAIESFSLDFSGQVVADIGASTGGFADCALQNGAARVYAIDVGYGQLHWQLRQDQRVISMERTNARYLTAESLPEPMDWVVSDVAFISIIKIMPAMLNILKPDGQILTLIKPQFEAGREHVGKKGVVKDPQVHKQVLTAVLRAGEDLGLHVLGLDYSPIRGPEGNVEYLAWFSRAAVSGVDWPPIVERVADLAQEKSI